MLSKNLGISMAKLLGLLLEWQSRSELEIIPEHSGISTDICKVEDLTSRLRHLVTSMEVI